MVRGSPAVAVTGLPGLTTVALAVPESSVTRAAKPTPTTSVAQTSATITTFRWVSRLAASSEKLFMTPSPTTSQPLVAASRRKVHALGRARGPFRGQGAHFPFRQFLTTTRAPCRSVILAFGHRRHAGPYRWHFGRALLIESRRAFGRFMSEPPSDPDTSVPDPAN